MLLSVQFGGHPGVRELAAPSLPDIAMVSIGPDGKPVILYNPMLCREAGPALCDFYRFHEYAHIALRHHQRQGVSAREKEEQADRWAARHAPLASVMAAYHFFSAGGGGTPLHGHSARRAERMLVRVAGGGRYTPWTDYGAAWLSSAATPIFAGRAL
jgi:hypothetical protein